MMMMMVQDLIIRMSTVKRPREPEKEKGEETESSLEGPPLSKRRRQSAAEEVKSAKEAVAAATASAASSSSSAAAAPSFAPVMGYCCVNPLLGQCVPREIKELKQLQATGSKLSCAKTKAECEKSCVLPPELLRNVARNLGYPEPDLPRLYQSMLTPEAKVVYLKNLTPSLHEVQILDNLLDKSASDYEEEETAGYKELILRLNKDLGKNVAPEIGIWIASRMLYRMKFEYHDPDNPEAISLFTVSVLNALFRRGYVDRYSSIFQRLLWSNIVEGLQEYVMRIESVSQPTGLLMMIQLAGQEPKSGAIWTRNSLSDYLTTLDWKGARPKTKQEHIIDYFSDSVVGEHLIGPIQARLPLYMIEALYRWILDKTIWCIIEQVAERQDWKLPPLDNLSSTAYVGNVRDPWWKDALQQRFEDAWSIKDERDLKILMANLAELPVKEDNALDANELAERERVVRWVKQNLEPTTFAQKYAWLKLLMASQNMVPRGDNDEESTLDTFTLKLLSRVFYLQTLEYTIELANKAIKQGVASSASAAAATALRLWPPPFTYPAPGSQFAVGARMLTAPIPPPMTSTASASASTSTRVTRSKASATAAARANLPFFPVAPATFTSFQSIVAPSTAFAASPAAFASSSSSSSSASALPKKNAGSASWGMAHKPLQRLLFYPRIVLVRRRY